QYGDLRRFGETEVHTRVLGGEVAAAGLDLADEPLPIRKYRGDESTRRELRQAHLEPVPGGAGVVQEDQPAADRVDGDVHAPVVVVVGRRYPAPVDERARLDADGRAHVGKPALDVRQDLECGGVLLQVRDRYGAVRQHQVERAVAREVDPRSAPAGREADGRCEDGADIRERGAGGRLERGVPLATRVRHADVGPAVAGVGLGSDAHPGVRVGDARLAALLDEVEPEWAAGLVHVQPVRVEVVGDGECGPAVAVHVREHGPEGVVDVVGLDAGLPGDVLEHD